MIESELRTRLKALGADSDPIVEQRAWETVRRAYTPAPTPVRRRPGRRRLLRAAAAVGAVLVLLGLAVSRPPRDAVGRWLREAIGLATTPHARPRLDGLPGGGELLVNASAGPWIVTRDGHRHYLGRYAAAAWSPHSLYVIAWRRNQLDALAPSGRRQWRLDGAAPISAARWSPDGYRIVYLSGRALWVVNGDRTGNRELRARIQGVPPAWQPDAGSAHRLAFVDGTGAITVIDTDSGARIDRIRVNGAVRTLAWSPDGTRLLAGPGKRLALYDPQGHLLAVHMLSSGQSVGAAAFAPRGDHVAVVIRGAAGSSIGLLPITPRRFPRPAEILFSARAVLAAINWSPDNRWLLVSSPTADQWIFIRTRPPLRIEAISRITTQFVPRRGHSASQLASGPRPGAPAHPNGFPVLGGWQSRPPGS